MRKRIKVWMVMLLICSTMVVLLGCGNSKAGNEAAWQEQYDLGVRYLFDGNYEEAIIAFEKAIQIDDKRTAAYIGASDAYVRSKNDVKAVEMLEKVLEMDGKATDAYIKLSDIYVAREDYESAIRILEEGIAQTGDEQLKNIIGSIEAYLAGEMQEFDVSNAKITFKAIDERRGQASLTIDNMPLRVVIRQKQTNPEFVTAENWTSISFSNGEESFAVDTNALRTDDPPHTIVYPQTDSEFTSLRCLTDFEHWRSLDENCQAFRQGNTITWNFTMPEWGFSLKDVKYVGYLFGFETSLDIFDSHEYYGSAVYEIVDNEMRLLEGVSGMEELGYQITEDQFHEYTRNEV